MRVLFLTLYPESVASARYRVLQFIPYLESRGMECTVASALTREEHEAYSRAARAGHPLKYHFTETRRRIVQVLEGRRYDITFVQKAITTAYIKGFSSLLDRFSKRIVYDLDDAVHLQPPVTLSAPWSIVEDRAQVQRMLAKADLVLAGNRWLAEKAGETGARTYLFPTVVDTDRFVPPSRSSEGYTVGWMGSPSTAPALKVIAPLLDELEDASIRIIGLEDAPDYLKNAQVRPWEIEHEVEELQNFDVGIMPLAKDEWTKGKCALKALQYMACGAPCIATPYGAVLDVIAHNENGLLADSVDEWRDGFETLRDPRIRGEMGERARQTVVERYSLSKAAPRLFELLESIA